MTHFVLSALLLVPATLRDAGQPPPPAEALKSIREDYQKIEDKFSKLRDNAKTYEERSQLAKDWRKERQTCVRRALALARAHLGDPSVFDALEWIVIGRQGYYQETWDALYLIQRSYAADRRVAPVCQQAILYHTQYLGTERLLRTVLEKNPDRAVQGSACLTLARVLQDYAGIAQDSKDPATAKRLRQSYAHDLLDDLQARGPDKLQAEAERFYQRTIEQFADVTTPRSKRTLGQRAEAALFELRHLQVGKQAPEIEAED